MMNLQIRNSLVKYSLNIRKKYKSLYKNNESIFNDLKKIIYYLDDDLKNKLTSDWALILLNKKNKELDIIKLINNFNIEVNKIKMDIYTIISEEHKFKKILNSDEFNDISDNFDVKTHSSSYLNFSGINYFNTTYQNDNTNRINYFNENKVKINLEDKIKIIKLLYNWKTKNTNAYNKYVISKLIEEVNTLKITKSLITRIYNQLEHYKKWCELNMDEQPDYNELINIIK